MPQAPFDRRVPMKADFNPTLARLRPRDQVFYVSRNRTVLATARDGMMNGAQNEGLFVYQTRVLSVLRYWMNDRAPVPVGVSNVEEHSQIAYYVWESPNPDQQLIQGGVGPGGRAATQAIGMQISRFVSDGLREQIDLRNHTQRPVNFTLELELDGDFADAVETHVEPRPEGSVERAWRPGDGQSELVWTYTAEHEYEHQGHAGRASLRRESRAMIAHAGPAPSFDEERKRVRFELALEPQAVWRCTLLVSAVIDGRKCEPAPCDGGFPCRTVYEEKRDRFLEESTQFDVGTPDLAFVVRRTLEQARRDLVGLRLYDLDRPNGGWTLAAGLPVYIAYFGRDTLTVSWQAASLSDRMMVGTLAQLADTQATERDDWRDAQPGRFVHEMETGPHSALMYNPKALYFGALTNPGFYPVVVSTLWQWTGDRDLVRPFLDPALRGLAWLERDAKRADGFYAYQTRSEQGVKNQSWKDSYDAIVYPDGGLVQDPIAPTEFQAYVFAAKVRMSELLWWFGDKDGSKKFFDEAMDLRDRFNDVFWMHDEHCFGMGLDPAGKLIRSVGSESAHAIAAGIAKRDRVEPAVDRLFEADLFSGWGVRTLSSGHAAFNPFSYHRGSVWPAEQAAFCMGLMRWGLHGRLHQMARAQFEAAALFDFYRLPEAFSGHPRDEYHPIPAIYPHADSPQAWSSSGVVCMIQAMLGLFPYAPLNALFVDPHLPEWLPRLRLANLRVGSASLDIEFRRTGDGSTAYRVLDLRGKLRIIRQPSPWSLTAGFAERVVDALASFLPGY